MAVSNAAWDGSPSRWNTPNAYCASCLIDTNSGEKSKAKCHLPIREPGGAINRNAVHAAAQRIGSTQASPEKKRAAAKKLISLYRNTLGEDPPESLARLAG